MIIGIIIDRTCDGKYEERIMLYACNKYPYEARGDALILWQSVTTECQNMNQHGCLWLWVHPGCYESIWYELQIAFGMKNIVDAQISTITSDDFVLKSLKDQLCRYRLIGPMSTHVLQQVFEKPVINCSNNEAKLMNVNMIDTKLVNDYENETNELDLVKKLWWSYYYCSSTMNEVHHQQWLFWQSLKTFTAAQLQSHLVLALTVKDPRLKSLGDASCQQGL